MKPLYTKDEYDLTLSAGFLKLQCHKCDKAFFKKKCLIQRTLEGKTPNDCRFCSSECVNASKNLKQKYLCKLCDKEFLARPKEEKIFCTKSCSATFNNSGNKKTEETKNKIRASVIISNNYICSKIVVNECLFCEKKFVRPYRKRKVKYCSLECSKNREVSKETRQKLSLISKERVNNGTHNGWQSRKIISYPEQFFINVFKENKVENYKHNKKVGKYFLDFAFDDLKLDVEIDGKQHDLPERKIADKERDEFLESEGWKVYRISWKSVNTDDGRQYIKEEINKLMDIIL